MGKPGAQDTERHVRESETRPSFWLPRRRIEFRPSAARPLRCDQRLRVVLVPSSLDQSKNSPTTKSENSVTNKWYQSRSIL